MAPPHLADSEESLISVRHAIRWLTAVPIEPARLQSIVGALLSTGKPSNPGVQLLRTRSREINSRPPWRGTRRLFVRTRNNPFPYSAAEPARAPRQNLCSSTFLTLLPCRIVLANNPPRIETQ